MTLVAALFLVFLSVMVLICHFRLNTPTLTKSFATFGQFILTSKAYPNLKLPIVSVVLFKLTTFFRTKLGK